MGLFEYTPEFIETVNEWDGKVGRPSSKNQKINRLRVYKNKFVEKYLATSHPITPGIVFGPMIIYGFYDCFAGLSADVFTKILIYALGVFGFTIIEYTLHRWGFHYKPTKEFSSKVKLFKAHGYHHQFPNDKWRLVAPPIMSWPLGIIIAAVYWPMAGAEYFWPLFGGTLAGYLFYDWSHYYTHHFRNPKFFYGKIIRRSHMIHHYKLYNLNMGICTPLWDIVFGTSAWTDSLIQEAMATAVELEKVPEYT